VFIFSTTEMHKIPSTIVSRCQYFCFNKFTSTQIEQTINKVANAENIKITDEAKKTLVSLADGHARDVLSMFEQVAMLTDNNIDVESVNKIFGLVDINKKINFINLISANNLSVLLNTLNEYIEKGINLEIFCLDLINILLDKIIYLQTSNFSLLKLLTKENINSINLTLSQLFNLVNIFEDKVTLVKTSSNAKFYLEKMLIEATGIFNDQSVQTISAPIIETIIHKEEVKVQVKTSSLPKLEDLFSIREIKINKQPTVVIKKEKTNVTPSIYTSKDVVYATASNCNSTIGREIAVALEKLKQSNSKVLKTLLPANKVLLSSKNSAILSFDDVLDAELLNKNLNNQAFYEEIKSVIGKPMHFVGLTDAKFREMIKEYMSGSKKDYKELQFSLSNKESVQDLFDKFLN
jgi:DNA polymerase-3 subunit gamma/tau